jgi:hypothetical protein
MSPDPSLYATNEFIDATYAFDNGTVYALLHVEYEGPPLLVNSDAFVNIARLHTHMPRACQWNDLFHDQWCVRFKCSVALLSVSTLLHACTRAMFTLTFVFTNTHGPQVPGHERRELRKGGDVSVLLDCCNDACSFARLGVDVVARAAPTSSHGRRTTVRKPNTFLSTSTWL